MPWESFVWTRIPSILIGLLLGFLVALWWLRRRRRGRGHPWQLDPGPGVDEAPWLNDEASPEPLFKDLPALRPVAPERPTAGEAAVWQRAYERLQELLAVLRGDHKALGMVVWYPHEGRQRWRARLGYNLAADEVNFVLDLGDHPELREWVLEKEQAFVTPLSATPTLRSWEALAHHRSSFWVPIRYFHRVDRLVLLTHPGHGYFQPHRARLITTALTIAALEGVRLWYDDLLQRIKTQWVQWEKRLYRRLARQLHDGPAQTVAALAMEAGYLRLRSKRDPQATLQDLKRLEDLAREAAKEIRHLLFILRPVILEEEGLAAALHDLASKMQRLYRQQVILELSPEVLERIQPAVQTLLFYITVEGLNNAAKHAEAETVWVRLRPDPRGEHLILEIEDNGKGFDPQQVFGHYTRRESLGLLTLQERVRRLGGRLEIHSQPGQGTRLVIYAPYEIEPQREEEEETDTAEESAAAAEGGEAPAAAATAEPAAPPASSAGEAEASPGPDA